MPSLGQETTVIDKAETVVCKVGVGTSGDGSVVPLSTAVLDSKIVSPSLTARCD